MTISGIYRTRGRIILPIDVNWRFFAHLFVGDVFGHAGRRIVGEHLGQVIEHRAVDLVVVNAENAAGGLA